MIRQLSPKVEQLIQSQMASGKYASEDELLLQALNALCCEEEDLAAIQSGLAWFDAGNAGTPVEEAFAKLARKYDHEGK
jgi:hypothetical protein